MKMVDYLGDVLISTFLAIYNHLLIYFFADVDDRQHFFIFEEGGCDFMFD